jgi:hypothetical protein
LDGRPIIVSLWQPQNFECSEILLKLSFLVSNDRRMRHGAIAGMDFSMSSNAYRAKRLTDNPPVSATTTGVLLICSVCHLYMYPRTFHCPKCGICTDHQIGHIKSTGCCVSQRSWLFVVCGAYTS